jgi:hypothetical protein
MNHEARLGRNADRMLGHDRLGPVERVVVEHKDVARLSSPGL